MNKVERSRYWLFTINNPLEHGFSRDKIKEILEKGAELRYYCISDEVGKEGTPHTHFYVYWVNQVDFKTASNKFNGKAHIDYPEGSPEQNRDYVFKEGKWMNDPKGETNLRETHEEYGECPIHTPGKRNDLSGLYKLIKEGYSNYEIYEIDSYYMKYCDRIDRVRKTIQSETVKNRWREVDVEYIWGVTGMGKTRGIMEKYGYDKVYRVTDYLHPFDSYAGQDVVLFEEFRSSLRIDDMLKYLDGYPVELSCRYSNQQAMFTKVYFATNIDLRKQYPNIQTEEEQTWLAFLRRIKRVTVYENEHSKYTMATAEYLKNMFCFFENPFENDEHYKIEQGTLTWNKQASNNER